ncbi:MAG: sigma 54-interacting transcriptional regulator [Gammaproteobacteria bacterium]
MKAGRSALPAPVCDISAISERELTRVWEQFVDTGDFGKVSPRAVIARSWERSRQQGINPHAERAPTVFTNAEIEAGLARADLGQAGRKMLDSLAHVVDGTRHVIVLADANGRILYSVGHRQIQEELEVINFCPGGSWLEQDAGPNGIGTPLAVGRPELVLGSEHYCRGWQPWVCYGAPVLDGNSQNKQPLGVVDITGPANKASQEAMVLAMSIAQSVGSALSVISYQRREQLRGLARDRYRRWPQTSVLVVDQHGAIVDANAHADRRFGPDYRHFFNQPVSKFLPDVWHAIEASLRFGREGDVTVNMQSEGGILQPVHCRIEPVGMPVNDTEECLGALLILEPQQNAALISPRAPVQKHAQTARFSFDSIVGNSEPVKQCLRFAEAAASDPAGNSVLLVGETGTGKELLAHSIHAASRRASGPFIAINCGALPGDLIESELFGYSTGAFTGACRQGLAGKFELAHNGTLFLDEIDSLAPDLQAKFLRVLDNKEITRLGSTQPLTVDVRIIAAATPDLHKALADGLFRLDLYHRLCVLEVAVPPLRERGGDVVVLAQYFIDQQCQFAGRKPLQMSAEVKTWLAMHAWPGNIRELRNLAIRWVLTVTGTTIDIADLPAAIQDNRKPEGAGSDGAENSSLRRATDTRIRQLLIETGGNVSEAARRLGVDRSTIYRRQRRWRSELS